MSPISQYAPSHDKNESDEIGGVHAKSLAKDPADLCLRIEQAPLNGWIDQPSPTAICTDDEKDSGKYENLINHLTNSSNQKGSPIKIITIPMNT
jgi:hypothetical protein